jgi:hypothetical protein
MAEYIVHVIGTCSWSLIIEADDEAAAIRAGNQRLIDDPNLPPDECDPEYEDTHVFVPDSH